jgi:cation diffusion facilitator CzcD-associated flavoprotein CzcO
MDAPGVDVDVAIIGAGFGGLAAAIQLGRHHSDLTYLVLEKGADVGGTWRDNSYPGCACDVPSHLYSFSFAPNPDWSSTYSGQPEIWAYLRDVAARFGVAEHVRFNSPVTESVWDEGAKRWQLTTSTGAVTARFLITATGPLSEPSVPDLPGLADFAGSAFHSARWDHAVPLAGKRVAVIGTGASAIQFVPLIADDVASLTVFQRTPPWVIPHRARAIPAAKRRLYRRFPVTQKAIRNGVFYARELMAFGFLHPKIMKPVQRQAVRHLHKQVADPALRAKLTPDYTLGCKRVLISNTYYPALNRPNVDVRAAPITRVTANSIVTADGAETPADAIIFGTGFRVTDMPIAQHIRGRDGTLAEAWHETMTAYLGMTVTGFPNLFLLLGPNTGLGHNSVVLMIEAQVAHLMRLIAHAKRQSWTAIEPTARAQADYVADVDRRMAPTVWMQGGCKSWYLDAGGRNSTLWPGFVPAYQRLLKRFDPHTYDGR